MNTPKKVIAIHDMVGFGRASLTNIIPTLSAMGIQVCPVPTAVLSTHLGGFGKPAVRDLSSFMDETAEHFKKLNLSFDCIYPGYLSSNEQAETVLKFFENLGKNSLIAVDPVIADGGKFYSGMDYSTAETLKKLIAKSDIIFPNYTEACFLLGEKYHERNNINELKEMLLELSELGAKKVVMTSVPLKKENIITVLSFDAASKEFTKYETKNLGGSYPGTGDIFASVVIGSLLCGKTLQEGICHSMNFISSCISYTKQFDEPINHGVMLEPNLHLLSNFNNEKVKVERI